MEETIYFFDQKSDYFLFSNFAETPFVVADMKFPTNEHFYHYSKYKSTCPEFAKLILSADTPYKSKLLAQQKTNYFRYEWQEVLINQIIQFKKEHNIQDKIPMYEKWEEIKIEVMYEGLKYKYDQSEQFRNLLNSTKGKYLVENSPYDSFWGCGTDKKGSNMLGKLLVILRDKKI